MTYRRSHVLFEIPGIIPVKVVELTASDLQGIQYWFQFYLPRYVSLAIIGGEKFGLGSSETSILNPFRGDWAIQTSWNLTGAIWNHPLTIPDLNIWEQQKNENVKVCFSYGIQHCSEIDRHHFVFFKLKTRRKKEKKERKRHLGVGGGS